jgi:hypothetical protein
VEAASRTSPAPAPSQLFVATLDAPLCVSTALARVRETFLLVTMRPMPVRPIRLRLLALVVQSVERSLEALRT